MEVEEIPTVSRSQSQSQGPHSGTTKVPFWEAEHKV